VRKRAPLSGVIILQEVMTSLGGIGMQKSCNRAGGSVQLQEGRGELFQRSSDAPDRPRLVLAQRMVMIVAPRRRWHGLFPAQFWRHGGVDHAAQHVRAVLVRRDVPPQRAATSWLTQAWSVRGATWRAAYSLSSRRDLACDVHFCIRSTSWRTIDVQGLRGDPRGVAGHCDGEPTCASSIPPAMSRTFYNTNAMRVSGKTLYKLTR
jgi:hypothetical protein